MGHDSESGRAMRFVFPATEQDVRQALRRLTDAPPLCHLPKAVIDTVVIVVVEALNNIVEHAYAKDPGEIDLRIDTSDGQILVEIIDAGLPLPGLCLPDPKLPDPASLPEGGFGWFLIHELTNSLSYQRDGNRNILRLGLPVSAGA